MRTSRNLKFLAAALAFVVGLGTLGFHYIEGWPWFDGFYMVITTLTTIGYQEVHPLSHAGRVFNVIIILGGVGLVFLAIGFLTQALLEFELQSFFGRRRMEREIGRLTGHYIICGAGRVGRSAARELARRPAQFVIVESNESKVQKFASENWLVLVGDATQEQTLREARIDRARGLVAATTTDATNLYIVLTARSLNPSLRIIARASEDDGGETPAQRRCRCGRFSLCFCRTAYRPFLPASARGQFPGHRHHPSRHGSGDRRSADHPAQSVCRQDHRDLAHPPGPRRDHPRHQARGGHALQPRS